MKTLHQVGILGNIAPSPPFPFPVSFASNAERTGHELTVRYPRQKTHRAEEKAAPNEKRLRTGHGVTHSAVMTMQADGKEHGARPVKSPRSVQYRAPRLNGAHPQGLAVASRQSCGTRWRPGRATGCQPQQRPLLFFFFCGQSAVLRPSVHMLPGIGWCGAGLPPFPTACWWLTHPAAITGVSVSAR